MDVINYAPVCGLYCGDCHFLGKQCAGCGNVEGKPFWKTLLNMEICPLHECCRNQKQLEHCGLCDDVPCETFLALRDPNMRDDEFQKSLTSRHQALKIRAEIGTDDWLKEKVSS